MSPLRRRSQEEQQRTTNLELFYDLVFVFAVTQVSHLLLADLSFAGAGKSALVLLLVWWAWNYTTWVTNELDPDSDAVRLLPPGIGLERLAAVRSRARGEPSPLEQLDASAGA